MAYFPMFIDLEGRPCLVVGGGAVALRKARALLEFGARVTAVAPRLDAELVLQRGVDCVARPVRRADLAGAALVVAATDRAEVNRQVAGWCREESIPVNVVDVPELCSFTFPAYALRGPVAVGISTGGNSPALARHLRRRTEDLLPDWLGQVTRWLGDIRPGVMATVEGEERRRDVFDRIVRTALGEGRTLTEAELRDILEAEHG